MQLKQFFTDKYISVSENEVADLEYGHDSFLILENTDGVTEHPHQRPPPPYCPLYVDKCALYIDDVIAMLQIQSYGGVSQRFYRGNYLFKNQNATRAQNLTSCSIYSQFQ